MNGIVQKVVCFFALLLVMSIGSVAHAQQQSYYVYEHTYSESAKSKTVAAVQQHDLLVLQNGKLAYEYDMLPRLLISHLDTTELLILNRKMEVNAAL